MSTGKVYLIGAGPGDPSLLTLRAVEALGASDVVVYDDLVNPEVLAHARPDAWLVSGGKRGGAVSISQAEINRLLVEHARLGRTVARLKGGDPFVFGRGGEEAEALVEAGIAWEVIPGVSAGHAVAAYAGIPLTHRDVASTVVFVTGHDAAGKPHGGVDWSVTARAADTLVVFMCARTIGAVAEAIVGGGRSPETPIAVIRWGTYDRQEVYVGTLGEAAGAELAIAPPALAVVGEVVRLRERLAWFSDQDERPLRSAIVRGPVGAFASRKEAGYGANVA